MMGTLHAVVANVSQVIDRIRESAGEQSAFWICDNLRNLSARFLVLSFYITEYYLVPLIYIVASATRRNCFWRFSPLPFHEMKFRREIPSRNLFSHNPHRGEDPYRFLPSLNSPPRQPVGSLEPQSDCMQRFSDARQIKGAIERPHLALDMGREYGRR